MMEAEIRAIPNGVYRGESHGLLRRQDTRARRTRSASRSRSRTSTSRFDYSDTDAQTNGLRQRHLHLERVGDAPHLPADGQPATSRTTTGWSQPIEIVIPEGTILNAAYPAATTFGNHLCPPNADAIIRALAPVDPGARDRGLEPAALLAVDGPGSAQATTPTSTSSSWGSRAARGRLRDCDGYDHIGMIDASGGVLDQDYEMFEQQTPHRLLDARVPAATRRAPGKHRGGLGVETRYRRRRRRHADRHLRRRRRRAGLRALRRRRRHAQQDRAATTRTARATAPTSKDLVAGRPGRARSTCRRPAAAAATATRTSGRPRRCARGARRDRLASRRRASVYGVARRPETLRARRGGDRAPARRSGLSDGLRPDRRAAGDPRRPSATSRSARSGRARASSTRTRGSRASSSRKRRRARLLRHALPGARGQRRRRALATCSPSRSWPGAASSVAAACTMQSLMGTYFVHRFAAGEVRERLLAPGARAARRSARSA